MGEVDVFVGRKIRARRVECGMSQAQLADAIGVRFQQIQKYETGMNRVSASRLWAIAESLQSPVEFFFGGINAEATQGVSTSDQEPAFDNRSLTLVRNFQKLPETQKRAVLAIVTSMAGNDRDPRNGYARKGEHNGA